MDKASGKLTVYFEEPFWVGVFERIEDGKLSVAKVIFGAEPKDYEVQQYIQKYYASLKFSPAVDTVVRDIKRNPKRMQREAKRQMQETCIGTKSQQALKLQQEQNKQEHKIRSREEREGKNNMKYPIEENLPYAGLAIIVLAVFYAIYFAKMISQKRHGIQTHQIGRVKEKSVHRVEVLMSIATFSAPVIQIMSIIFGWNHMSANARFTGFCIGMLGDLIFLFSVLCMKDSWRAGIPDKDKTKLVTAGIYRYSRNPAFLGFDFMYIGLLLMYFNLSMLAVSVFAIIMLHLQILQEERYLTENFGESYREYRKHVFRYLGRR